MTTEGPRPEGLWRARVHGEFTVVDLVREDYGDGSFGEAVNAALAGYGWIQGWDWERCRVELLEPLDPSRPLGTGMDREAVRAALRAGRTARPVAAGPTLEMGKPHPSHAWTTDGSTPDWETPDTAILCTRCLARSDEPPGWAPCRVADSSAKMAEAVGELTKEGAPMLTLAEPGTEVPLPPAGSHQLGALEQPGWSGLGCTLCGKRASAPGFDAIPCPANP